MHLTSQKRSLACELYINRIKILNSDSLRQTDVKSEVKEVQQYLYMLTLIVICILWSFASYIKELSMQLGLKKIQESYHMHVSVCFYIKEKEGTISFMTSNKENYEQ